MFRIKQLLKMFLQNILLPLFYAWYARKPVEQGRVIFADAHHEEIPFSMRRVYEALTGGSAGSEKTPGQGNGEPEKIFGQENGALEKMSGQGNREPEKTSGQEAGRLRITAYVRDFEQMPYMELLRYLLRFMKEYATAEYVFVCDYYLPVASCRKRPETKVVQLWHSCGLMKKIAYDAGDDIPKGYRGDMFGNYTYLTLSAPVCVPVHAQALRLPQERICAVGVSRTDYYFDEDWNDRCRRAFRERYPQARGRKIALWAPTFRGNAAKPWLEGLEEVRRVSEALSEEWYFVIKAHPHIDAHGMISNCAIPTEELLPVADLLITDYSSVMFDFLFYQRPIVLFAPDLEQYGAGRGFYIDYRKIPYPIVQTEEALARAVRACGRDGSENAVPEEAERFREEYVGACDGHATERILKLVGLNG